jgi:hypothetical protein
MTPEFRERALKAYRLSRKGLKGKAIAQKLKLANAAEGNDLAQHGFLIARDERERLSEPELLLLSLLASEDHEQHYEGGISRSIQTKTIDWRARKARGWCFRTANRRLRSPTLDERYDHDKILFGFVDLSHNGYIYLTPAGRALVHAITNAVEYFKPQMLEDAA